MAVSTQLPCQRPPLLVVCHPGHELRVFGWSCHTQPIFCVLTDGSGRNAPPRIASSQRVVEVVGGTIGPIFGRYTDRFLYDRLRECDFDFFRQLVAELTETLIRSDTDWILGDDADGFNSGHDTCRILIDAVVERAQQRLGRPINNYAFALVHRQIVDAATAQVLHLDEALLARKFEVAFGYTELRPEIEAILAKFGPEVHRIEELYSLSPYRLHKDPYFETWGQQMVNAGHYQETITQQAHLLPLVAHLRLNLIGAESHENSHSAHNEFHSRPTQRHRNRCA